MADDPWQASAVLARIRSSARETVRDGGRELAFQAMGTHCRCFFADPAGKPTGPSRPGSLAARIMDALLSWVAAFEAKYSRFWPASLISRINAAAGREPVPIDRETEQILALCGELAFLSRGAFDPTALPLLRLWDWKQPRPTLPTTSEIQAAQALVGWRHVLRKPGQVFLPKPGMALDLGGMGKEYAVDQALLLLGSLGVRAGLIDFGADVRVLGLPPDGRPAWHIGLEAPGRPGTCWTSLAIADAAVATSGDYHRKFERDGVRYGHIVDLRAGRPAVHGVRAVSVIAPTCTQAGLISTSALVLGPVEGLKLIESSPGVAGAIVTDAKTFFSHRFYEYMVT